MSAALAGAGRSAVVDQLDWGGERYLRTGAAMPDDAAERLRERYDAVLFGAVGRPDVAHDALSWGLILPLRQRLGLWANIRPVRAWPGVPSPIAGAASTDMIVVRENSEGEYADIGGRVSPCHDGSVAVDVSVHTREAVARIARHALELASRRRGRLTVATKSNSLRNGYRLWDEVVRAEADRHPGVEVEFVFVDALAARIVQRPGSIDVLLASNLFGDILSDLASVLQGGLGMAPSANLRPGGAVPGIYEPVHGSAPDIAGKGIANPIACVLAVAMLLEDCGCRGAAAALSAAAERVTRSPRSRTPDIGGSATTAEVGAAIVAALGSPREAGA
jgi:tartrate dehydrogenase/decarboxylase / D-malate dehydrogenase